MGQLVLTEAGHPPEGLPTLVTLKRLLRRMASLMRNEAGTIWAPWKLGSVPSVHPLVLGQRGALAEGLPTLLALVGPLPGVGPLVSDQLGLLAEGLPTLPTAIRPLPGVHPLVVDEAGALTEGLPTLLTPVGLLSGMNPLMLNEF